jgi:hypothetical protein
MPDGGLGYLLRPTNSLHGYGRITGAGLTPREHVRRKILCAADRNRERQKTYDR